MGTKNNTLFFAMSLCAACLAGAYGYSLLDLPLSFSAGIATTAFLLLWLLHFQMLSIRQNRELMAMLVNASTAQMPAASTHTAPEIHLEPEDEISNDDEDYADLKNFEGSPPAITHEENSKTYDASELLDLINRAINEDRIDMLLQPIVSLPQRKVRHYECFSRIRDTDGTIIIPQNYIPIAEGESLIRVIDNTLLFRCIQLIRKAQKQKHAVSFFCNVSVHSLLDKEFFTSFVEFIKINNSMAPHLIFELEYSSLQTHFDETCKRIEVLAKMGCRFSLDNVKDLNLDLKRLAALRFRFLKIDVHSMIGIINSNEEANIKKFLKKVSELRMDIIVTHIEYEKDLVELLDFNFDYGQGYLFCPPRLKTN